MALDDYRQALRSAVRGLWSGALDADQYWEQMRAAINRELALAWLDGAQECGVESEDDYSPEEWLALGNAINEELSHVADLAQFVADNDKTREGLLETCFTRLELWYHRYQDVRNQAKLLACKDEKLEWVLGPTERHCGTCPALNGRVKRASYWRRVDVKPQAPPNYSLECLGFA